MGTVGDSGGKGGQRGTVGDRCGQWGVKGDSGGQRWTVGGKRGSGGQMRTVGTEGDSGSRGGQWGTRRTVEKPAAWRQPWGLGGQGPSMKVGGRDLSGGVTTGPGQLRGLRTPRRRGHMV